MEGVVAEVHVRAPCKRFAIKDNGFFDRSARGFGGHNAKLHSFFSLRTIRVVTRTSANSSGVLYGLPTNEWRSDSRVVSAIAFPSYPVLLARSLISLKPLRVGRKQWSLSVILVGLRSTSVAKPNPVNREHRL
jgi:hypothetical protein